LSNRDLVKAYTVGASAVGKRRIVKFSGSRTVVQAAAATDLLIGVADYAGAIGGRVDVVRSGIAEVEFGGAVTRGAKVTSDANGKAVAAAPAAGANVQVLGVAEDTYAAGDFGEVFIAPSVMQG
jgi:hypothetical protein